MKQDVFSIGLQISTKPDWDGSDRPSSLALAFKCHVVEASRSLAFELYGCLEFAGCCLDLEVLHAVGPWLMGIFISSTSAHIHVQNLGYLGDEPKLPNILEPNADT